MIRHSYSSTAITLTRDVGTKIIENSNDKRVSKYAKGKTVIEKILQKTIFYVNYYAVRK
jgi:UDP-glucose 4-epimerase